MSQVIHPASQLLFKTLLLLFVGLMKLVSIYQVCFPLGLFQRDTTIKIHSILHPSIHPPFDATKLIQTPGAQVFWGRVAAAADDITPPPPPPPPLFTTYIHDNLSTFYLCSSACCPARLKERSHQINAILETKSSHVQRSHFQKERKNRRPPEFGQEKERLASVAWYGICYGFCWCRL